MSLFSMPLTIRSTQRLGQIALTLTRHHLGPFVGRVRLRKYLPWKGRFRKSASVGEGTEPSIGRRIVESFEELGPIFVKLGQLLSSRPDIVPPDILEDLRQLQDRVAPFPSEQAYEIIKSEFKKDVSELFKEFNPVPLASGSIAQAHRAVTRDGEQVIVKVRRPNIEHIAQLDLHLLQSLARNIEKYIPELRGYRPTGIVEEFSQTLLREMDMLNEAAITDRINDFFRNDPTILVPKVQWDLTSGKVLTMTYISGKSFTEIQNGNEPYTDKPKLARILMETFMRQVLELGVFHADPHPGNIIIIPPDKIGLVDFGMAGQLDRHRNISFLMLLAAGKNRHMDLMIDILTDMNAVNPETNFDLLKRDMAILLDKYRALPLKHISFQMIFNEIATLARNHKVFLPRDFVLVFKSLVVISGTAMQLDPTLNPTEVIEEKVREAFGKLFDRQNISRELTMGMWHSGLLLKELPEHLRDFSRKLLRGQIKTQMDIPQMDNLIRELDHSSNRLSFSMIIAAIIIGSSMIFNTQVGPKWGGVPLLGLTGYIVAGIMGLWLVVAILRSGKLS